MKLIVMNSQYYEITGSSNLPVFLQSSLLLCIVLDMHVLSLQHYFIVFHQPALFSPQHRAFEEPPWLDSGFAACPIPIDHFEQPDQVKQG